MRKLIISFPLVLAACSSDFWQAPPPCDNAACMQAQIQMLQAFMGNLQQANQFQQMNLMNTQNNLALIAAGTHLETPRYEPVPFPNTMIPLLHVVGE